MLKELRARYEKGKLVMGDGAEAPPDGAEVIVVYQSPSSDPPPLAGLAGRSKPVFRSAAEVDAFIRRERGAWDS
jgi:hypothetical protein